MSRFHWFVMIVGPTRYNILISNKIRHFSWLCRLSGRHAVTSCHPKRYVVFYGYVDYPADTRKTNNSIDLWQIQFSDCRADTRKLNSHNDLRQSSILARGGGAARAHPSPVQAHDRGPQSRDSDEVDEILPPPDEGWEMDAGSRYDQIARCECA